MRTAILSLFASLFAAAVLAAGASLVAAPGAGLRVRPADWPANQRRKTDPAPPEGRSAAEQPEPSAKGK